MIWLSQTRFMVLASFVVAKVSAPERKVVSLLVHHNLARATQHAKKPTERFLRKEQVEKAGFSNIEI